MRVDVHEPAFLRMRLQQNRARSFSVLRSRQATNGGGRRICMALEQAPRCGPAATPDGTVHWRVWAPNASRVELVLLNGEHRRDVPMQPEEDGFFSHAEPNIAEGQRYAYRLDGGPERPDPASAWQPDGVHRP